MLHLAGKKFPKWTDQARAGIYLGPSPQHARSVALVLSLTSGLLSPQFHVTVDNFQTMRKAFDTAQPRSLWQFKCKFVQGNIGQVPQQDKGIVTYPSEGDPHWTSSEAGLSRDELSSHPQEGVPEAQHPQQATQHRVTGTRESAEFLRQLPQGSLPQDVPAQPEVDTSGLRRSQRASFPPQRLIEALETQVSEDTSNFVAYETRFEPNMSTEIENQDPLLVFAASADPDTMYLHEAMKQPDKAQFKQAMKEEVDSFDANNNWRLLHHSKVPQGATVLPAVWQMKRKRKIATHKVYKWKARLNLDESKQVKDINYWDTYAPVTS
jgi:hypothetical protein